MPAVCVCATHSALQTNGGGAYPGTASESQVVLALSDSRVNVLNIPEANLAQLTHLKFDPAPTATTRATGTRRARALP